MDLQDYSELTLIKALPEKYILKKDSGLYGLCIVFDNGTLSEAIIVQYANETLKDMLTKFYTFHLDEDIVVDLANEDYNEKTKQTI